MFSTMDEKYLYQEGYKATTEMYDLLSRGYFSKPGWSLGLKADDFGTSPVGYSSVNYRFGNSKLSDHKYVSHNDNSRNNFIKQKLSAKDDFVRDSLSSVNRKVFDKKLKSSSDSGSDLQYSSFVDDVLSQSSERSSTRREEKDIDLYKHEISDTDVRMAKTLHSSSVRKNYSVPLRNRSSSAPGSALRSRTCSAYDSKLLGNKKSVSGSSQYVKKLDWADLHRQAVCEVEDLENWRWKWENGVSNVAKGIVNLDKNQMSQLEDENEKLRKKISEFQRENIKLKEDYNELKIYNDKAQQTIKDLKSCLEDARTERSQLVGEIKKLKDQGMNNTVSSIVNHYIEKGLYEDAEKDSPLKGRSRSQSPVRFSSQQRSISPTFSRPVTPAGCSSPVKISEPSYTPVSYTPMSRSQTPTQMSFNYEDISPALNDDEHEIYPHRRTRSYVQKYGAQNEIPSSQVDLNDPEIQEFLKPKTKLTYDLDLNENDNGPLAKRKLLYSPYMDKDYVPRSNQNDMNKDSNYKSDNFEKVHKKMEPPSQRKTPLEEEWESRKFIAALDHAVKQTPAQIAQERFLQDLSSSGVEETARWRSPAKGILKNTKSAQNMSIKESISPNRRSIESRSFSPAVRSPLTFSQGKTRSFTPDSRLYGQATPVRSYSGGMSRTYSPNNRSRSQSPKTMGQRSYSPGNRSYSPGYRAGSMKDSGYSTPTQQTRYHSGDNRDYGRPRTPVSSRSQADKKKSGLLSEEERRYADLLIDKYTRQQFIGIPLASS